MPAGEGLRRRDARLPALGLGIGWGTRARSLHGCSTERVSPRPLSALLLPSSPPWHLPAAAPKSPRGSCVHRDTWGLLSAVHPLLLLRPGPPQRPHVGRPRWGPPAPSAKAGAEWMAWDAGRPDGHSWGSRPREGHQAWNRGSRGTSVPQLCHCNQWWQHEARDVQGLGALPRITSCSDHAAEVARHPRGGHVCNLCNDGPI